MCEHILSFPALTAATYQKEKRKVERNAGGGKTFLANISAAPGSGSGSGSGFPQIPHFAPGFSIMMLLACYV